jgi:hypothetical protein
MKGIDDFAHSGESITVTEVVVSGFPRRAQAKEARFGEASP